MNRPGGHCRRRSPDPGGTSRSAGPMPGTRGLLRGTAADPGEAAIHKINVTKHGGFERRPTNPALLENVAPLETLCATRVGREMDSAYVLDRQIRKAPGARIVPQAWTMHGRSAGCVPLRLLRSGGQRAPSETCGDHPRIARSPVETVAHGMRLRTLPEALEPGSIRSF
jgi:hypothetical protein